MSKSFRLRQDTKDWFSNIQKTTNQQIKTDFDLYYFCLMLGLATGKYSDPTTRYKEHRDFRDEFVSDYKPHQNLIIGLLIKAELSKFAISLDEKEDTKKHLIKLIDPSSITNLTNEGIDSMNAYASGGFDYLTEKFDSKPYHVEEFLISYVKLLQKAVDKSRLWN